MSTGKSSRLSPAIIPKTLDERTPAQAADLEEYIIGSVLLEAPAYEAVKDILQPDYFYVEAHRHIYAAVKSLYDSGSPHADIRLVRQHLTRSGVLDKVGGAPRLVELTMNVTSAANILHHAHIVIEMYVKRELAQIGYSISSAGMDESVDALESLNRAHQTLNDLNERIYKRSGPQRIAQQWTKTLLTSRPDEPPPILHIEGIPMAWPGGHTLIVGKKKSRKTLFIVWLVTEYLKSNRSTGEDVLIFDTEQSKRHVYAIREKILSLTKLKVPVFYLRGMSPEERQAFIRDTVAYWPTPPQLIVVDGIRDMMNDINDPKEATQVITWLEKITLSQREGQIHMPHVLNVLHLNKGDSNPRGHIGTELQNKADCTIELTLDEKSNVTDVKCESSRERPFNPMAFVHDEAGLPQIVTHSGGEVINSDDRKNRLFMVFEDGALKRKTLIENIKSNFSVGTNRANSLLAEFRRLGWIIKSGSDHSPDTVYKLTISPTTPEPPKEALPPTIQHAPKSDIPDTFDENADLPF
jgi:hypothetical protein